MNRAAKTLERLSCEVLRREGSRVPALVRAANVDEHPSPKPGLLIPAIRRRPAARRGCALRDQTWRRDASDFRSAGATNLRDDALVDQAP